MSSNLADNRVIMQSYTSPMTSDDDLLISLFRFHPQSSEEESPAAESSSLNENDVGRNCPVTYEQPFDDPDMEPVPFESDTVPSVEPLPLSDLPSFKPSSLQHETREADLIQSALSILFEAPNDIVPSKRTSEDLLSVTTTRSHYFKRQRLSPEEVSCDQTVMRFRPYQDQQWNGMFQKLVQYRLKHGHCSVPHSYQEDRMLARWVKRQRYQHTKLKAKDPSSTMTARRIQQLESIGFVWHSHESAWQTKLNELKAFKQRTGHCNVPSDHSKNSSSLPAWIRCQRRQYLLWRSGYSSTMTEKRYELLKALGFNFEKFGGLQRARSV
ncbi:unnamed protein product [Cylindrotheca closterium]|uniref:Helicase-associated domain-containing protein n=1 Tax=Cylindrotheca closterium TaxID=2856 RepID=A0AAD2CTR2_9STRA|nr:unnamed protein product [Cylindrotheca closterium]